MFFHFGFSPVYLCLLALSLRARESLKALLSQEMGQSGHAKVVRFNAVSIPSVLAAVGRV